MPTFYSKAKKIFLSTNPKVISSTLKSQNNLERANRKDELLNMFLKEIPGFRSNPHYLIVRCPYKRTESFFKEKLRSKVQMLLNSENPYTLKLHQAIFFPYAKINEYDDLLVKKEKLLNFSFDQFIQALPDVYMKDAHLKPQSLIYRQIVKNLIPFGFSFDKLIKLEDDKDMHELSESLNINLRIRLNSSLDTNSEIYWSRQNLDIINSIYSLDFQKFNYSTR